MGRSCACACMLHCTTTHTALLLLPPSSSLLPLTPSHPHLCCQAGLFIWQLLFPNNKASKEKREECVKLGMIEVRRAGRQEGWGTGVQGV